MADEPQPVTQEEIARIFGNLSEKAREKLVSALAQYIREREQQQELLSRVRDLK